MNLIILDDICDGGQTFVELAKHLKAQGAKAIYLYITHGIFSKGLSVLKQHFEHVYCYHTMLKAAEIDRDFLTILEDK
jgi:ribose-phosphate pyrophosphokinase